MRHGYSWWDGEAKYLWPLEGIIRCAPVFVVNLSGSVLDHFIDLGPLHPSVFGPNSRVFCHKKSLHTYVWRGDLKRLEFVCNGAFEDEVKLQVLRPRFRRKAAMVVFGLIVFVYFLYCYLPAISPISQQSLVDAAVRPPEKARHNKALDKRQLESALPLRVKKSFSGKVARNTQEATDRKVKNRSENAFAASTSAPHRSENDKATKRPEQDERSQSDSIATARSPELSEEDDKTWWSAVYTLVAGVVINILYGCTRWFEAGAAVPSRSRRRGERPVSRVPSAPTREREPLVPSVRQEPDRRRRRGTRRANRERQVFAAASTAVLPAGSASIDRATNTDKVTLLLGADLMHAGLALNASDVDDACPVCLDPFHGRHLSSTYCAVLSCQHACCLPCIKQLEDSRTPCPICRQTFRWVVETATTDIFLLPDVNNLVQLLPGVSLADQINLVKRLLHSNKFDAFKLIRSLEDIAIGSLSAPHEPELVDADRRTVDWTPEEKEQIYLETQRPVLCIRKELREAQKELRQLRFGRSSPEYVAASTLVEALKRRLVEAVRNAREDAYYQINGRGSMGALSSVTSDCQVDFHSLHVRDAKAKFDELVLPILPVLGRVRIITGKGRRSASGVGVLRAALTNYIEEYPDENKHKSLRWESAPDNEGVIIVSWTARKA